MVRFRLPLAAAAVLTVVPSVMGGCSESQVSLDTLPCGGCAPGEVCGENGVCMSVTADCTKSCGELGLVCGDHCGVSCGACGGGKACVDGQCSCTPTCVGATCGDPDGCGGVCAPCPSDQNCADCALRAHVVDKEITEGQLTGLTIAIDYNPPAGAPLPGIADLRLKVEGPATVARVGLAQRLVDAGKSLTVDGTTGRSWQVTKDGHVQLLVLSPGAKQPIDPGRLAVIRFRVGETGAPALVPVVFSLVQREQIFAPRKADEALWSGGFGDPISVWPEVPSEN